MISYKSCQKAKENETKKFEKKCLTDLLRCDNLDWLSQTTETSGNSSEKSFKKIKKFLTSSKRCDNLIWLSQERQEP